MSAIRTNNNTWKIKERKERDDSYIYYDESLKISSDDLMSEVNTFEGETSSDSDSSNSKHTETRDNSRENTINNDTIENITEYADYDNELIEFDVNSENHN